MTTPTELELKLELEPSGRPTRRPRGVRAALPEGGDVRQLRSRYFDTEERALHRRGLALRVRDEDGRRIQTLKAARGSLLLERSEWEASLTGDLPDLALVPDAGLREEIEALGSLVPVFETRVSRTTWLVRRGPSEVEIALDEGEVTDGRTAEPIREVELELKDGSRAVLFEIARELAAAGSVRIGVRAKSDRGYGLGRDALGVPVKADKVVLDRDGTAGDAFQTVARACIRHFRRNEPGILEGRHVESLHQARVALRRLRSAFGLFRDVIAGPEAERLKGELRIVSTALGEARNLDVYLSRKLEEEAERHPDEPGLADLRAQIEERRERAYDSVLRRLNAKRFRLVALDLLAFVEAGDWLRDDGRAQHRDEPGAEFAARMLKKRWRKVRTDGRHLDRLDAPARHEVRIAAKKLRYASEFFASLFAEKRARRLYRDFVGGLEQLQGSLGDLNDIATGHEMALELAKSTESEPGAPALLFAAGHVSGTADAREAALIESAVEAHRALRKLKPFWK